MSEVLREREAQLKFQNQKADEIRNREDVEFQRMQQVTAAYYHTRILFFTLLSTMHLGIQQGRSIYCQTLMPFLISCCPFHVFHGLLIVLHQKAISHHKVLLGFFFEFLKISKNFKKFLKISKNF